jgi:hypothetical protein
MGRLQFGIVRYASVATAVARELALATPPECRIGQGRVYLTFRGMGASHWEEARQTGHALKAAEVARAVFRADSRAAVRRRAERAVVVVYEDAWIERGCAITARWECVVPRGGGA